MNVLEKANGLFIGSMNRVTATGIDKEGKKIKLRLFKKGDSIYCLVKNSRKYGTLLQGYDLLDIVPIVHHKTTAQKWESSWKKVKARLEASGLWKEVVEEISFALDIDYEKINTINNKYWEIKNDDERLAYIKQMDARVIATDDTGKEYVRSSLIYNYSQLPKVKKMYFGKHKSEAYLERIKKAMEDKKSTTESARANYDVSFEFNAEKNKAWYSEEYKGCGNGHYYLALDATHVLFYEDD